MPGTAHKIDVYFESGKKRTFAGAIDWPGWCRAGRDEAAALEALLASGPRYARILEAASIPFEAPSEPAAFHVIERLEGNATTDFGAPDAAPEDDQRPIDQADFERFQALLKAYWQAFDEIVVHAKGKELRKGPRGGGRDLEGILRHVLGAERGYLSALGWKPEKGDEGNLQAELERTRQNVLDGLAAASRGEIPDHGPRGGVHWRPRYFVRRLAWHVIDHTWEIEDRML